MPLPNWLSGKRVVPEESMKADGSAAGAKSADADGSRSAAVLWAIFKPGPRAWQPAETEPLKVEQWQPPAAPSQSPQAMRRYSDHKKVAVTKLHVVVWNVRSFLGEVRADAPRWAAPRPPAGAEKKQKERIKAAVRAIEDLRPNLVVFLEVDFGCSRTDGFDQAEFLCARLKPAGYKWHFKAATHAGHVPLPRERPLGDVSAGMLVLSREPMLWGSGVRHALPEEGVAFSWAHPLRNAHPLHVAWRRYRAHPQLTEVQLSLEGHAQAVSLLVAQLPASHPGHPPALLDAARRAQARFVHKKLTARAALSTAAPRWLLVGELGALLAADAAEAAAADEPPRLLRSASRVTSGMRRSAGGLFSTFHVVDANPPPKLSEEDRKEKNGVAGASRPGSFSRRGRRVSRDLKLSSPAAAAPAAAPAAAESRPGSFSRSKKGRRVSRDLKVEVGGDTSSPAAAPAAASPSPVVPPFSPSFRKRRQKEAAPSDQVQLQYALHGDALAMSEATIVALERQPALREWSKPSMPLSLTFAIEPDEQRAAP